MLHSAPKDLYWMLSLLIPFTLVVEEDEDDRTNLCFYSRRINTNEDFWSLLLFENGGCICGDGKPCIFDIP